MGPCDTSNISSTVFHVDDQTIILDELTDMHDRPDVRSEPDSQSIEIDLGPHVMIPRR